MTWSKKTCYFGGKDSEVVKFNLRAVGSSSFVGANVEIIVKFDPVEGLFVHDVLSSLLGRIERLIIFLIG